MTGLLKLPQVNATADPQPSALQSALPLIGCKYYQSSPDLSDWTWALERSIFPCIQIIWLYLIDIVFVVVVVVMGGWLLYQRINTNLFVGSKQLYVNVIWGAKGKPCCTSGSLITDCYYQSDRLDHHTVSLWAAPRTFYSDSQVGCVTGDHEGTIEVLYLT